MQNLSTQDQDLLILRHFQQFFKHTYDFFSQKHTHTNTFMYVSTENKLHIMRTKHFLLSLEMIRRGLCNKTVFTLGKDLASKPKAAPL